MKSLRLAFLGISFGFLIAIIGFLVSSIVTERQAIMSLGYYELVNPRSLGDFIFVGRDRTAEPSSLGDICPNADGVLQQVTTQVGDIGAFKVAWVYSDFLDFLPWRTSIELPVVSVSTSPFAELFNAIVKADDSCEGILAERSRHNCLLVVSSVAIMENGNNLVSLSGCQLIGAEDPFANLSSFGPGRRYKDIYGGVSTWERFWFRLREPFIRTSNLD